MAFVDAINQQDLARLTGLMTDDHRLCLFDEAPLVGRERNRVAWKGYFDAYAEYVIHPEHIQETTFGVAIVGSTTGSHLGLADEVEREESLIWIAQVVDGRVAAWRLVADNSEERSRFGIT